MCPECGRPLVEVLVRDSSQLIKLMGKHYTSKATLFGMPAICVALGIGDDGKPAHARGWIAIGGRATGVIAVGGMARGVVAVGGLSVGVFTFSGVSLGLLGAFSGVAISPFGLAFGGVAIGLIAVGGVAIGGVTAAGVCIGWYAWGPPGACTAKYLFRSGAAAAVDPDAAAMYGRLTWLFGRNLATATVRPMYWLPGVGSLVALLLALPALFVWHRHGDDDVEAPPTTKPSDVADAGITSRHRKY